MASPDQPQPADRPAPAWFLPAVLLLFVGSGCAALIYEIVWLQLLSLVIGSSAISLGLLLATYLGGMCLGSLAVPRLVTIERHPLRVYALLELGIGALGIVVLMAVPLFGQWYLALVGDGNTELVLRGLLCAVCLLPPTLLMGATLPVMARWCEMTTRGVSWLGFFYAGNTLGAVIGCLLAGFYLLRLHDIAVATGVAVTINLVVAVAGVSLASIAPYRPPVNTPARQDRIAAPRVSPGDWQVYIAIALSGVSALGAEVVWTRLLSLAFGGTTYTFSIILAVFLVGLGIGSSAGAFAARTLVSSRVALGVCQLLLIPAITWTAWIVATSSPYGTLIKPGTDANPWLTFSWEFVWCGWAMLPAACLWGAGFPLALAAITRPGRDVGRIVGRVWAANTFGAIVGALAFSLNCIPTLGTQQSQRLLIGLSALAGLTVLIPLVWSVAGKAAPFGNVHRPRRLIGASALVASIAVAAGLAISVPEVAFDLIAYGRLAPLAVEATEELYRGEGMNSTVAVGETNVGLRSFHVSGKVEATNAVEDMRLQRLLANLPAMLHPEPRSVLVVGFGAGVTAGSFLPYPEVNRLVICEIEPLVPNFVADYFVAYNFDVARNPRVEVVYDDARHYVLTTREKFDIITSDPIHPWVKGAATLYTQEYFEHVKEHLNPGGIVTQWVPIYESNHDAVKSEIATFFKVFPHGSVWSNAKFAKSYDLILLGSVEPMTIDLDAIDARMQRSEREIARSLLEQVSFQSPLDVLGTFAGQDSDLRDWLKDAEINRDRNLRLQYLAGMTPNASAFREIYAEILAHRGSSGEPFVGSQTRLDALRASLDQGDKP